MTQKYGKIATTHACELNSSTQPFTGTFAQTDRLILTLLYLNLYINKH